MASPVGEMTGNMSVWSQPLIVSGGGIIWAICKCAPRLRNITTPAPSTHFLTGWIPFLPPNQQHQSTEDINLWTNWCLTQTWGVLTHFDNLYTVFQKIGNPLYFLNNFFKCWSIWIKLHQCIRWEICSYGMWFAMAYFINILGIA